MRNILSLATSLLLTLAPFLPQPVRAAPAAQEIGIVVMHGKGGSPGRHVVALADALEKEGFLVANIEMPWSFKRHYDIELDAAVGEVTRALDAMRAKGAKKLFVSGHSQGGIFALLYGGRHKVDGVAVIVPGGAVDSMVYLNAVGGHVARARQMIAEGRGGEKAEFADYRMEIKVNFLDKLRLEAKFDDFTVVADQPIRYKGDGSAPGPFDYFLASSALCAAYFVKLYCDTRNIPTDNIRLSQNNIVDPENRYKQIFKIQVELPADISDKDRQGILRSIDRCTVKKVVQTGPEFVIEEVENLDADAQAC
jgi:uncharacterized OsmC-like protein